MARTVLHPMKVLLFVWWDCRWIIRFELSPTVETITAKMYCSQLTNFNATIQEKRFVMTNASVSQIFSWLGIFGISFVLFTPEEFKWQKSSSFTLSRIWLDNLLRTKKNTNRWFWRVQDYPLSVLIRNYNNLSCDL